MPTSASYIVDVSLVAREVGRVHEPLRGLFQPAAHAVEAAIFGRPSALLAGRNRVSSVSISSSACITSAIMLAVAPTDISNPLPRLIVCPTLCSAGAVKPEIRPRAVSVTNEKSRVGLTAPRRILRLPEALWLMMVGITARADCRGPKVL